MKGNQPRARTGCWFPSHRLPSKPSRSAKQLGSRCRGPAESRRSQAALPSLLRLRPQPNSAFVAIRTVQHYASVVDKALSDPARKRALPTTMRPAPLHLACFFAAFTSSPPPDAHEFRGNRGAESSLCVSTAPRAILLVPQYFYCDSRATGVACWYYFQSFYSPRLPHRLVRQLSCCARASVQRLAPARRGPGPRGRTRTHWRTLTSERVTTRDTTRHTPRPPATGHRRGDCVSRCDTAMGTDYRAAGGPPVRWFMRSN